MSLDEDTNTLKRQIKDWEHSFIQTHSRPPSKDDVKQVPKISKLYKAYKMLKKKQLQKKPDIKPDIKPKTKLTTQIDIITGLTDDEADDIDPDAQEENSFINQNVELGPTPQAGGKVLSIFDLKMTPPESSPLKNKQARMAKGAEFKTPTKHRIISQVTPLKTEKSKSFMDKINMVQNSPIKTPLKTINIPIETPQYLNRNIKRLDFSRSQNDQINESSPFESSPTNGSSPTNEPSPFVNAITQNSSPIKTAPSTPATHSTPSGTTNTNHSFKISPSPFKRQGLFGSKKLMDVYQEHKNITIDEQFSEQSESEEEELETHTASPLRKRRAKTQKRSTRRWKMKPNVLGPEDDGLRTKNIHKVLQDINEVNDKQLDQMANEGSDEELEPAKEVQIPKQKSTGRKVAPISHNYKRLKIHHKKGNNRWGRGRR